jgi:hypothetical protein
LKTICEGKTRHDHPAVWFHTGFVKILGYCEFGVVMPTK